MLFVISLDSSHVTRVHTFDISFNLVNMSLVPSNMDTQPTTTILQSSKNC